MKRPQSTPSRNRGDVADLENRSRRDAEQHVRPALPNAIKVDRCEATVWIAGRGGSTSPQELRAESHYCLVRVVYPHGFDLHAVYHIGAAARRRRGARTGKWNK